MGLQDNTLFDHPTTTDRLKLLTCTANTTKEALEIVHLLS